MNKLWGHFKTITAHKIKVTSLCFRCGLYKQGIKHDLSKYSPIEFCAGVRYFQGNRSPIDKEKELHGYSLGWLHHKGRNPHHWEYWIDQTKDGLKSIKMPVNYIVEMFCDRVAASEIYHKQKYNNEVPLQYYLNNAHLVHMQEDSKALIHHLLLYLAEHDLEATIQYIRADVKERGYLILKE